MNTIYRAQQNQLPYIPPPDISRIPGNRRVESSGNNKTNKISFKSYYQPPGKEENQKSIVDLVTESILITVFKYTGEEDLKEKLKTETKKFEEMDRALNQPHKLNQFA